MSAEPELSVECPPHEPQVYMETCEMLRPTDHAWVIASECQQCGARYQIDCAACVGGAPDTDPEPT